MAIRPAGIERNLAAAERAVAAGAWPGGIGEAAARWRADAAALRFHLLPSKNPPILAVIGGTGTGKSTLVNRLLGQDISAASFRRTFTGGPVAAVKKPEFLAENWLALPHRPPDTLPTRGQLDELVVAPLDAPLLDGLTLVDTPDLDGDQPAHHAQADRVFRWSHAALFLVTPEKYQMTELLPYYRLAKRYGLPTLFVMNKVEESAVLQDYESLLTREGCEAAVYAIARDDAGWNPPPGQDLAALRDALGPTANHAGSSQGLAHRTADLASRLADHIAAPLRARRQQVNTAAAALRAMETPAAAVDVNPITEQLQRRLQQRSVLYLIGPQRVLDRVRQVPGLLARLPRTAWDIARGKGGNAAGDAAAQAREVPDFAAALVDQFVVVQSRIDDVLRSSRGGEGWISADSGGYGATKIDPTAAGKIAEEQLAELREWLEKRWNGTPRDTALLMKLLHYLPGGDRIAKWSEAAPYLLTVIVATHHAFFGHIDLMVLGGYSLLTWLTERVSNEVAGRTRLTNRRIEERFAELAHQQISRVCKWLEKQAPNEKELAAIEKAAADLAEAGEP